MNKLWMMGVAIGLAACATKPILWDKPGATQIGFAQDRYQCQQQTAGAGAYAAFGAPLFVAVAQIQAQKRQQAMFEECMEAQGYSKE